jgi:hypothetical protein
MESPCDPEETLAGVEDGEVMTVQQEAEAEETRLRDTAEDDDEEEVAEEIELTAANKDQWTAPPNSSAAESALSDLKLLLNPPRLNGKGHLDPKLNPMVRERLEAMKFFLVSYLRRMSQVGVTHRGRWTAASLEIADNYEKGPFHARKLREWTHDYITDRSNIPENPYGAWSASVLDDEDVVAEINLHLTGVGKWMKAADIVHFTGTPDMLKRLKRTKPISLRTAQRWLNRHKYRWGKEPSGQFVDGHERADVVDYRQAKFLPSILKTEETARKWTEENINDEVVIEPGKH